MKPLKNVKKDQEDSQLYVHFAVVMLTFEIKKILDGAS